MRRPWLDPDWRAEFRSGVRDMLPAFPGIFAWGLVTGVAMVKGGLSVPMALLMTLVAYAGSAQLASLPLIATSAPIWIIGVTAGGSWSTAHADSRHSDTSAATSRSSSS
jgi:predicted branched-subunit amino acid permease